MILVEFYFRRKSDKEILADHAAEFKAKKTSKRCTSTQTALRMHRKAMGATKVLDGEESRPQAEGFANTLAEIARRFEIRRQREFELHVCADHPKKSAN